VSPGAPVLVYTRAGCPHCDAARADLTARGVAFRVIDIGRQPEAIPELLKLTRGRRVVPVIVDRGRIEVAPAGGTSF